MADCPHDGPLRRIVAVDDVCQMVHLHEQRLRDQHRAQLPRAATPEGGGELNKQERGRETQMAGSW